MNCYGTQGGCIKLPMQRALHHYTHYINTTIGFSTEVDQNLLDIAFLSNDTFFSSWIKYIIIKNEFVYDKFDRIC